MPYLQPKTNNPFGFMPAEGYDARAQQVTFYTVSSSEGTAILPGDMVVLTSINTARVVTGTFSGIMLGIAAGTIGANAGSTSATLSSGTMLPVYDSPFQIFVVNDTTSFLIGATGANKSYAVAATGPAATFSTAPGRSIMTLSGATGSSAGGPVKVIGMHPVDGTLYGNISTDGAGAGVAASVRKWLVQPSNHIYGANDTRGVVTS